MFSLDAYRSQSFGFKFDVRVEHLTAPDMVVVMCAKCEHVYRVAPHHLLARFPPQTKMIEIAAHRMKCRRCGAKGKGALAWHVLRAFRPVRLAD